MSSATASLHLETVAAQCPWLGVYDVEVHLRLGHASVLAGVSAADAIVTSPGQKSSHHFFGLFLPVAA